MPRGASACIEPDTDVGVLAKYRCRCGRFANQSIEWRKVRSSEPRIDEKTKAEASAVLAAMGLTVSDAFRLLMVRVAKEKAPLFEPLTPNAATVRAMKEAGWGKLKHFNRSEDPMAELDAKD
jgi:DNA-damage-inducible protein J